MLSRVSASNLLLCPYNVIVSKMPTPTLSERIAKLNLQNEGGNASSGQAQQQQQASASKLDKSTGAKESVKDKISKFSRTDEVPLVPSSSFGFSAPMRRQASQSSEQGTKGRVASLGVGRAPVPLDAVERRSASTDSSASSSYKSGFDMSRTSSTSDTAASSKSTTFMAVPSSGPPSLSSLNVETGSTKSEPRDLDTPTVRSAVNSPLSSPLATPTSESFDQSGQMVADNIALPEPVAVKGPLASLKAPPRNMSAISVSSLLAEDGSVAGDDTPASLRDAPDSPNETPEPRISPPATAEPVQAAQPTTGEDDDSAREASSPAKSERDDASEQAREAAVTAELDKYEKEQYDKPMQPLFSPDEPTTFEAPLEPPALASGQASTSPSRDDLEASQTLETISERTPEPATAETPDKEQDDEAVNYVKCSDCGKDVDLLDLTTHVCKPAQSSPVRSIRTSPSLGRDSRGLDEFVPQTTAEVPQDIDEPVEPVAAPMHRATNAPDAPVDTHEEFDGPAVVASGAGSDVPADEEDDDNYEPGSVTIVRSSSRM